MTGNPYNIYGISNIKKTTSSSKYLTKSLSFIIDFFILIFLILIITNIRKFIKKTKNIINNKVSYKYVKL